MQFLETEDGEQENYVYGMKNYQGSNNVIAHVHTHTHMCEWQQCGFAHFISLRVCVSI